MFCRYCGKNNRGGAKFCVNCGKAIIVHTSLQTSFPQSVQPKGKRNELNILMIILIALLALLIVGGVIGVIVLQTNNHTSSNNTHEEVESMEDNEVGNSQLTPSISDKSDEAPKESVENTQLIKSISNAYSDDHNYYGNSFENVSQGGIMVAQGEWIYYTDTNRDNSIWKMKQDGSERTKVFDDPALYISVQNEWLYYRHYDNGKLCRYNLESGEIEVIVNRNVYEPKVVGKYIYYEDQSDASFDLYRIDIDGKNEEKLADGIVLYCCVTDDRIFYLDTAADRKGYSVDLNGGDKQLWFSGKVGTIDYVDGLIYYTDSENGGLFTLNPKTNKVKQISTFYMNSMNIYNGNVYYADGENSNVLTRTSLQNPAEKQILYNDACELINVCGGWIQFHLKNSEAAEDFYQLPISGGTAVKY